MSWSSLVDPATKKFFPSLVLYQGTQAQQPQQPMQRMFLSPPTIPLELTTYPSQKRAEQEINLYL